MDYINKENTFDRTVSGLCKKIDLLEIEVEYWKEKYQTLLAEQAIESNQRLESVKKDVANALMFAMSVKDDENGNLIIDKESRKILKENWKS